MTIKSIQHAISRCVSTTYPCLAIATVSSVWNSELSNCTWTRSENCATPRGSQKKLDLEPTNTWMADKNLAGLIFEKNHHLLE